MTEPIVEAADAATSIFNLPDYRVMSVNMLPDGRRRVIVETDSRRDARAAVLSHRGGRNGASSRSGTSRSPGAVEVLWSKYRWRCEEPACPRLSFFESTAQVPRRADVVDAVISSGRAVSETAAAFAVS